MAEGSIDPLVTPEDNQLDDGNIRKNKSGNSGSLSNGRTRAHHLRASIGSYHVGNSSMRHSTEISNSANNSLKKVPHYLRASTGSCHDFCKYGREHAFQEKPWKPLRKKTAKPLHNESPVQIIVSGEQKKEKIVKHKPSVLANNHLSDPKSSPDTKSFSPKPRTSSDKEKIVKHNPLTDIKTRLPNTKSHLPKPKKSLDTGTYSSRQNDSSDNKTRFPKYKPSPAKKSPSLDPPEIIKRVLFPSKKVEVPVKQGSSTDNKMSRTEKKTGYMTGAYSSSVKSCGPINIVKPTFSSANPDGIREKVRRNSDVGIGRKTTEPKAYTKKALTPPPSATLSPKLPVKIAPIKSRKAGNLKILSPLKNRNRKRVETEAFNNEKVSVKTLHVIETETVNNLLESTPDEHTTPSFPSPSSSKLSSHSKSSSLSSHEDDDEETEHSVSEADEQIILENKEAMEIVKIQPVKKKVQPVKDDHKKTLRKSRVVVSEAKNSSPVKLKFRSGKTVDLQSDNNTPRRLRFRRARAQSEEGKVDLRRRTLKKAEVNDDATGAELSSEKIVLKHQDVQGKKDAQGLFNNVIEETASKLVESRKSKVKALVGAFETVISLQESSKPSVQPVN